MSRSTSFQPNHYSWADEVAQQEEEDNLLASSQSSNQNGELLGAMGQVPSSSRNYEWTEEAWGDKNNDCWWDGDSEGSLVTPDEISAEEKSMLQKIVRRGLVATSAELEIEQMDCTIPLYSATSFEDLNLKPALLKGVYSMGFNVPSQIQESALPILLTDPPRNLIAQSQSGTGKTATFVLAMLSRVDPSKNYPQIICLSPTYELAIQTGEVIKQMAKFCPEISVAFAIRGVQIPVGTKLTHQIVIGTPGKMMDWCFRNNFLSVSNIRVFVLDEADLMIALHGFRDMSIKIHRKLPKDCQVMFFSSTYETEVMDFADKIVPDATVMRLKREEESLDNVKQFYILSESQADKYRAIANIYGAITIGRTMIFCQTRRTASWLVDKLTKGGHCVGLLSGELTVDERIEVLNRFRDGREKIMVTTNVMARGIDVDHVTLVVNFDLPTDVNRQPDCETYLHRIGRSGRFGKSGIAISLIDSERSMEIMRAIEDHFGKPIIKLDAENVAELEAIEN